MKNIEQKDVGRKWRDPMLIRVVGNLSPCHFEPSIYAYRRGLIPRKPGGILQKPKPFSPK